MSQTMRVYHRYLGFFLAGIMAIYALSGVLMIFRTTDFLKVEQVRTSKLPTGIPMENIGRELRIREFKVLKEEGDIITFKEGTYNKSTGEAVVTVKELPPMLAKLCDLHKATTRSPLFFLNIFFGISLLFFVLSAFWMFSPGSGIFKKGLYFTAGGIALALIMFLI
ncbi:MAG: hypothetical protein K1X47_15595 [Cyclobacteriaceae bacterium]|nr:hypothetical protein [Cyclobacteriaceae bacterium]